MVPYRTFNIHAYNLSIAQNVLQIIKYFSLEKKKNCLLKSFLGSQILL